MSTGATGARFCRVEHRMSTAITLDGTGIDDELADRFFARITRLEAEAVAAQSARLDIVSGATYTSRACATSLQAALDQAARGTGR